MSNTPPDSVLPGQSHGMATGNSVEMVNSPIMAPPPTKNARSDPRGAGPGTPNSMSSENQMMGGGQNSFAERMSNLQENSSRLVFISVVIAIVAVITMVLAALTVANTDSVSSIDSNSALVARALEQNSPGLSPGGPGQWNEIHPRGELPPPRLAHAACGLGHKLYIHGGMYSTDKVYSDLWVYDETEDSWHQIFASGTLPSSRLHHSLTPSNDGRFLFLFGGFNAFQTDSSHASYNDLYQLELASMTWTRLDTNLATSLTPSTRGAHDSAWLAGSMYIFGGFNTIGATGHSHELWRYAPEHREWYNLTTTSPTDASWPDGRIGFAMSDIDGRYAHIFGGGCSIATTGTGHYQYVEDDDVVGQCGDDWIYDSLDNTFSKLTVADNVIPRARRATHGDAGAYGMIFLYGGVFINGSSEVTMYDDLWVLDPGLKSGSSGARWMRLYPNYANGGNPGKRFGHSTSRLGGKVVIFGGRLGAPSSPGSNSLWEYGVIRPF